MDVNTEQQPGRPFLPIADAKRDGLVKNGLRTIRAKIERGDLQGFIRPGPKRAFYFLYTDQFDGAAIPSTGTPPPPTPPNLAALLTENANLKIENADLRTKLDVATETVEELQARNIESDETIRLLTAAHAALVDATEKTRQAAASYQGANEDLFKVVDLYRDALAQHLVPGNLRQLRLPDLPTGP
ncbi:Uncharacterised protein [Mycobacteroides abscessus subsp. abscessus]|uniref:hypothetical protein n=1 Tax=Mycobacteroides abscessus TaxID=36809 RepID=UPI000929510B|nr:hypothetical protein [Mycobacteroides abscessus]SIJ21019.1 Uncharacterised protein [Mycobacteroides abscessus subsp. abscessus]SLH39391.1 Uncharacterised protein [Mycobacteroides abscessus subsp. abscessus]